MRGTRVVGLAVAGVVCLGAGVAIGLTLANRDDPGPEPTPTAVGSEGPSVAPTPSRLPPSPTPTAASPTPSTPAAAPPDVFPAAIELESPPEGDDPGTEISIEYPQLDGFEDRDVQDAVNASIESAMELEVDGFLASIEGYSDPNSPPLGMHARYEVGIVTGEVFSFVLPISTYTGGAHPATYVRTFTFDLVTGEPLYLDDLFGPGVLETISAEAVAAIQEEYETGEWASEGASATEENLGRFVLRPDVLEIWFDNYQVGPYAIGTPSVPIPYATLAEFVPTDSPVARLMEGGASG